MKIQIWKRKNKEKNKNYIYIRYRFSQKKAYVESLNLWEWVAPINQDEKKHNEEVRQSYLETKRRKEDDLENKRLNIYNKSETKIYFKNIFFDLCYSNNAKSVYKLLLHCDKKINTYRLNEVVKRIELYSKKGDPILALPLNPIFYFLTDRVNPTPYEWVLPGMLGQDEELKMVETLRENLPKVVVYVDIAIDGKDERRLKNYAPNLYNFLLDRYNFQEMIGLFQILLPKQ